MSLFDISSWFTGQDETARGDQLDSQLAALNNVDYAPGGSIYNKIAAESGTAAADNAYALSQANIAADQADTASYNNQVISAAASGAKSGIANVTSFLDYPLFTIPLQWWLIAGAVLFFWIGGAGWLKGILNRKKS